MSAAAPPLATYDLPTPPQVHTLRARATVVGVAAALLCFAGGVFAGVEQFGKSWLFGFLFWMGITLGCLALSMIQYLTGGTWGAVIRRILEGGVRALPLMALLFLPIVFTIGHVYPWAHPGNDPILLAKVSFLNPGMFIARSVVYFAIWWALAHFMTSWSLRLDREVSPRLEGKLSGLSGAGLVILAVTITFSSVDWAMSLDPHWFSTVYGVLFMVGDVLGAMALVIVTISVLARERPLVQVLRPTQIHDLGKLMFAFVMLWAYISFSQFLIIWSGNLPEEIPWYLKRFSGGWEYLALSLVVFHFAAPFLLLLSRPLKRRTKSLAPVAAAVLGARVLDLFWLVGPDLHGGHGTESHFALHWMDAAALVGIGGLWLAAFARALATRPLVPVGDPEIREMLEAHP
jgi:hypothetical protein